MCIRTFPKPCSVSLRACPLRGQMTQSSASGPWGCGLSGSQPSLRQAGERPRPKPGMRVWWFCQRTACPERSWHRAFWPQPADRWCPCLCGAQVPPEGCWGHNPYCRADARQLHSPAYRESYRIPGGPPDLPVCLPPSGSRPRKLCPEEYLRALCHCCNADGPS